MNRYPFYSLFKHCSLLVGVLVQVIPWKCSACASDTTEMQGPKTPEESAEAAGGGELPDVRTGNPAQEEREEL